MLFQQIQWWLQNYVQDEEGQDLVEYSLLLLFIAIAAIAAVTLLGNNVTEIFNSIAGSLSGS
jgi:pilus assembly protein Flp/PilA